MIRERLLPALLSLGASAGLICACLALFPGLEPPVQRGVLFAALFATVPGFLGVVVWARTRPLLALALAMAAIFMRLTGVALIGIWLQANWPESLRQGLLAFLTFVGGFLLFEILALLTSGLYRFRPGRVSGPVTQEKGRQEA